MRARLETIAAVYGSVTAGVHRAPSIKVAEAAKVIENAQRDLNVAFMNELSAIFHRLGIDTQDVLAAAATKWNFFNFTPGLVGGHCIGVDPYYLTYRAQKAGYHPDVILAGRRINDAMGVRVARECVRGLLKAGNRRGWLPCWGLRLRKTSSTFATRRCSTSFASFAPLASTCRCMTRLQIPLQRRSTASR